MHALFALGMLEVGYGVNEYKGGDTLVLISYLLTHLPGCA